MELFNRPYRTKVLDLYLFKNRGQLRKTTEEWLKIYNIERPHKALNNIPPIENRNMKLIAFSTWLGY